MRHLKTKAESSHPPLLTGNKGGIRRTEIIVATSIILIFSYFIIGRLTVPETKDILFFSFIKPVFDNDPLVNMYQYIFQFFTAFVFLFIIPLIQIRYVFKEKLSRHGIQIGDLKFGLKIFTISLLILVPLLIFSSSMPDIQAEYPLSKLISRSSIILVFYEATYLFYYIGWEFFFRGYLQLGLMNDNTTKSNLFLIIFYQTAISTILHIGKPLGEILGAAIVGPIFGWFAIKSKSVIYVIGIHFIVGITVDIASLVWSGLL